MKKILIVLFLAVLIIAVCTGCSGQDETAAPEQKKEQGPIEMSLAHGLAIDSQFGIACDYFAEKINEKTNGQVLITVYPLSQLGTSREMAEGVQMGTIDLTCLGVASVGPFVQESQIMEGPFLFESKEHAYKFLDGEGGQAMLALFEPFNFKALAWWENGIRHLTTKKQVKVPEDMKGQKIRCQEIPLHVKTFQSMGALATPMQWPEVYTGLQQGTIDGQENPLAQIYTGKIYEVTDYLALTGHIYAPAILLMSEQSWNKLNPEQQKIFKEVAMETAVWQRAEIEKMEAEWLEKLKKEMTVIEVDRGLFKEAVEPVYDWYVKQYGGQEWLDAVEKAR